MSTAHPPLARLAWEPFAVVAILALTLGFAFAQTLVAMAGVWRTSESFAHGPLIPLASAWLVWRRRAELRRTPLAPWWPAMAAVVLAGLGWVLGHLAGVNTLEQFAVVGMAISLVTLVLGWRFAWAIAFPLGFLLFAVPFGTFMIQPMMDWTADFTVKAIQLSGIPVLREGNSFSLPTGNWSVVESCSGVRYLLAALPLGCLYAYLSYDSTRTRLKFVALTIAVALVSNWLRAYLIVMLGHLSDMRVAVGADHLVYGWLFFGVVMGLSFWLGGYLHDPPSPDGQNRDAPAQDAAQLPGAHPVRSAALALLAGCAFVLALPATALGLREDSQVSLDPTRLRPLVAPEVDGTGAYRPQYSGAHSEISGTMSADPAVGVKVALYVRQQGDREMLRQGNRVMPGKADDPTWQIRRRLTLSPADRGSRFPEGPVNEYVVTGPDGTHLVWEWFQVGGASYASQPRVKAATALAMLRGRGDESLAWFLWTTVTPGDASARKRLAAAADSLGGVDLRVEGRTR